MKTYAELKAENEELTSRVEELEEEVDGLEDDVRRLQEELEAVTSKKFLPTNTLDKEMMYDFLVEHWNTLTLEDLKCLVP